MVKLNLNTFVVLVILAIFGLGTLLNMTVKVYDFMNAKKSVYETNRIEGN